MSNRSPALPKGLKIGLVTGEYPPMQGGVGAFTRELARELTSLGNEVHIITSRDARPPHEGEQRSRLSRLTEPVDLGYAQLHPRAGRWRWRDINMIVDTVLRFELDLINIQYQPAAYNMRSPAINFAPWRLHGLLPTVVTFHDLRVPYLFPKAGPLRRWVVHRMARSAQGAIATNDADLAALTEAGIAVRQIPIGSNIPVHEPTTDEIAGLRARLGLGPNNILLAYFGFLNESKGADPLLQAMSTLGQDTHLVFIGGHTGSSDPTNEDYHRHIDARVRELALDNRTHWTGFLPDEEVSRYLYAADIVTMPYRDGVSLRRGTLMAALAHARPIISTSPSSPIQELRSGENIWLVPADDPASLAAAIRKLSADPALRSKLAQGAGELANAFSWAHIARQTLTFYQELLAASQAAP